ncbi:MAG TPA: hypothetical protein VFK36_01235 [Gemmatimonadales bacterium]|nr:hypothetical protein [Gemmatimonadales bacterium]
MRIRTGVYFIFGLTLLANLLIVFFRMWLGDGTIWLSMLLWIASVVLALAVLLITLHRSRERGRRHLAIVSLGCILAFASCWPIQRSGTWTYWVTHRAELDLLVDALRADASIRQLTDGQRYFASVNSKGYRTPQQEAARERTGKGGPPEAPPLADVLASESIAPETHERLRQQLIRLRFIDIEETAGYTALLHDGFLDNLNGFLRVEPGRPVPAPDSEIFGTRLVHLERLGGGWYYFGTS